MAWIPNVQQPHTLLPFEYSNHLNTGLVWYTNGRIVSSCQMVWYSNGGLKTGLKNPVYGPKCPVFKWSRDFTIWLLDTHTIGYSDGYCTRLVQYLECDLKVYLYVNWSNISILMLINLPNLDKIKPCVHYKWITMLPN